MIMVMMFLGIKFVLLQRGVGEEGGIKGVRGVKQIISDNSGILRTDDSFCLIDLVT